MANPVVGSEEWFQAIGDGLLDGESGGPITDTQLAGYIGGLDTLSNAAVKLIANTSADAAKRESLIEFAATLGVVREALIGAYQSADADTLQAAKDYADDHTGAGDVTQDELDLAISDAKQISTSYTDDQLDAANTANKTYTDSSLQIMQSALQSYADNAGTNAVDNSRTYTDDSLETLADGLSTVMDVKDQAILQEAKQYVIDHPGGGASSGYVDQGDANTLTAGKTYADGVGDNRLVTAKAYADTKKTEAQTYADNKDTAATAPLNTGRLMPYAKEIASGGDANTFLESGWYQAQAATNAPNADYFFYRTISRDATGSSTQEAIGINGPLKGRRLYRSKDAGVWGAWQLFDRQEMLDLDVIATTDINANGRLGAIAKKMATAYNVDLLTLTGNYTVNGSANAPDGGVGQFYYKVTAYDGSYSLQEATGFTGPMAGRQFFRLRSDGAYGVWNETTKTDTGWVAIAPSSTYTASDTPAYRVKNGIVYLRGQFTIVSGTTIANGSTVATLPAEARPAYLNTANAQGAGQSTGPTSLKLVIATTGAITTGYPSGTTTYVRLDGISYPVG